MFRLTKVLNGNTQGEIRYVNASRSAIFTKGEALITNNGNLTSPSAISMPEYIYLTRNPRMRPEKVDLLLVTENSVFKVEYTGNVKPYIGMPVGLSTHKTRMDGVTHNSNGKGTVLSVDDNGKFVFVRFHN